VLSEKPPHLADGAELRRHQVDALAGMLTELIAAVQKKEEANGNGNGHVEEAEEELDEPEDELGLAADVPEEEETTRTRRCPPQRTRARPPLPLPPPDGLTARRSPPRASSKRRAPKAC
jgi:hypothetical protein